MRKYTELTPADGRKSFYGKAKIYTDVDGSIILTSYTTDVCKVTKDGDFIRLWIGYSATTMRHVNAFLAYVGISGGGKAWWERQPIHAPVHMKLYYRNAGYIA